MNDNQQQPDAVAVHTPFRQAYFHGTKADLKLGDQLEIGYTSNYAERNAKYIYFTSTLDAAIWGAELAAGDKPQRIYLVEPIGEFEDDPNVTNKKFPGNPTMSYRSQNPIKVIGEITKWQSHSPEQLEQMKRFLDERRSAGFDAFEE